MVNHVKSWFSMVILVGYVVIAINCALLGLAFRLLIVIIIIVGIC